MAAWSSFIPETVNNFVPDALFHNRLVSGLNVALVILPSNSDDEALKG